MTDQEIRAKALELTIKAMSLMSAEAFKQMTVDGFEKSGEDSVTYPFIFHCDRFEEYIRTGIKKG